jgi:hypothetical protein
LRATIVGQDLSKLENVYDTVAREYAETFSGEHEKKPKDREILHRFSQEVGDRGRSGISALAPARLQNT